MDSWVWTNLAQYHLKLWLKCKKLFEDTFLKYYLVVFSRQVYAVASEDMDSLTFGSPRFLRYLMAPSSRNIPVMEFEISKVLFSFQFLMLFFLFNVMLQVLEELNLCMDQFIDLCILAGCDYCDTIRGNIIVWTVSFVKRMPVNYQAIYTTNKNVLGALEQVSCCFSFSLDRFSTEYDSSIFLNLD